MKKKYFFISLILFSCVAQEKVDISNKQNEDILIANNNSEDDGIENLTRVLESEIIKNKKYINLNLKHLNQDSIKLSEIINDKFTVLEFFTTWCPHCQQELPRLNNLFNGIKNKDNIRIIAISVNRKENEADDLFAEVSNFKENYGLDFDIFLPDDLNIIANDYKVSSIPTAFLIDKNGNIRARLEGEHDIIDSDDTINMINEIIK